MFPIISWYWRDDCILPCTLWLLIDMYECWPGTNMGAMCWSWSRASDDLYASFGLLREYVHWCPRLSKAERVRPDSDLLTPNFFTLTDWLLNLFNISSSQLLTLITISVRQHWSLAPLSKHSTLNSRSSCIHSKVLSITRDYSLHTCSTDASQMGVCECDRTWMPAAG